MLIVEQNANLVLEFADAAHVLETGRVALSGTADEVSRGRGDAQGLPGGLTMERFVETLIDGIATGSIYGALALALVLIYRSTGIVNFAQGEMAMFSTFVAWGLVAGRAAARPRGPGHARALLLGGMADRARAHPPGRGLARADARDRHARPVHPRQRRWRAGSGARSNRGFPSLFGDGNVAVGGVAASVESLGLVAVLLGVVGVLWLIFQRTKLGLAMRAAAVNPRLEPARRASRSGGC